jgi:mRNA interferase HigB
MKTHLIKERTIQDYMKLHASSKPSFVAWIQLVKNANWNNLNDIKKTFSSASLLGNGTNRVIFDIAGNNHRMICDVYFSTEVETCTLFVKWIGTHAQYDLLCAKNQQYTIDIY